MCSAETRGFIWQRRGARVPVALVETHLKVILAHWSVGGTSSCSACSATHAPAMQMARTATRVREFMPEGRREVMFTTRHRAPLPWMCACTSERRQGSKLKCVQGSLWRPPPTRPPSAVTPLRGPDAVDV